MSKAIEKPDETLSTVQPFEFSKEFTKSQHVHNPYLRNSHSKQGRILKHGCAHQQASV